jgi:hypothetical protein
MEAIKAELIRDQEEIQHIQQQLIALQERTRANRAWLKAYGFGEHEIPSPEPQLAPERLEIESTVVAALEIEDTGVEASLEAAAEILKPVERAAQPEVLVDSSSSNLKAEGRKKLYDALISRGARINS